MSQIDDIIKSKREQIQKYDNQIVWLELHRKLLESLPPICEYSFVHFNYLSHADTLRVIQAFGGKWVKTPDEGGINYMQEIDGITVLCYQAEPPPSCKIIEVDEFVPASFQQAYIRKVKKIQCPEPLDKTLSGDAVSQPEEGTVLPSVETERPDNTPSLQGSEQAF